MSSTSMFKTLLTDKSGCKDVPVGGGDDDVSDSPGDDDDDDDGGNVVMCSPTQTFDTRQEVTANYKQPHAVHCSVDSGWDSADIA